MLKSHASNRLWYRSSIRTAVTIIALGVLIPSLRVSAQTSAQVPSVRIGGDIAQPRVFTRDDLAVIPHRTIEVRDDKGAKAAYQGVAVVDLLQRCGVPLGKEPRGAKMKLYIWLRPKTAMRLCSLFPNLIRDSPPTLSFWLTHATASR